MLQKIFFYIWVVFKKFFALQTLTFGSFIASFAMMMYFTFIVSPNQCLFDGLLVKSIEKLSRYVDITVSASIQPRGSIFQNGFLTPDYHTKDRFSMISVGVGL